MFALVDGNNFYVSCERVFRPSLNGRPVVVLRQRWLLRGPQQRGQGPRNQDGGAVV